MSKRTSETKRDKFSFKDFNHTFLHFKKLWEDINIEFTERERKQNKWVREISDRTEGVV